jgi:hypothetical protein
MRRHLFGGIMAASLLFLVACGGDDDESSDDGGGTTTTTEAEGSSGESNEYVEVLAQSMVEGQDEIALDEETANCVATAVVDLVGADALEDAGVTPEDLAAAEGFGDLDVELPDDAADQLGGTIGDCEGVAEPLRPLLLESFVAGLGVELEPEATTCLEENIDDEGVGNALAAVFVDGSDEGFQTVVTDAVLACPEVPTAAILAQATIQVTPEVEECVTGIVEANGDLVKRAFVDQDTAAQEELGTMIGTTCKPG